MDWSIRNSPRNDIKRAVAYLEGNAWSKVHVDGELNHESLPPADQVCIIPMSNGFGLRGQGDASTIIILAECQFKRAENAPYIFANGVNVSKSKFSDGVTIGAESRVENCVFSGAVQIGENVILSGVHVGAGAVIADNVELIAEDPNCAINIPVDAHVTQENAIEFQPNDSMTR